MSRPIKLTSEVITELAREFVSKMSSAKLADGKISFSKSFTSTERKTTLWFTPMAWMKMQMLVQHFDKEVAWHGTASKLEDGTYLISDILLYPQEVTGATVNTDQTEYQNWLMSQPDEVFNNIRMQGHSHVKMSTSPSAVDLTHQEKILDQLDDNMFYIFLIWNKRNEKTIKIYDLADNILYETADVTVKIVSENDNVCNFLQDMTTMVKDRKIVSSTYKANTTTATSTTEKKKGKRKTATTTSYELDDEDYEAFYSGYGYGYYGGYKG